ncbi:MAG TPA: hypothetical protein VFY82_05965, partial [Acidimicrobiales bacterium]|nr:hypothetical protein [Acidimicrobiales bacterium]
MAEIGSEGHRRLLVEHVRRALVGQLGSTSVDVWLGKDGLERHDVDELARVAGDALVPLLDTPEVRASTVR